MRTAFPPDCCGLSKRLLAEFKYSVQLINFKYSRCLCIVYYDLVWNRTVEYLHILQRNSEPTYFWRPTVWITCWSRDVKWGLPVPPTMFKIRTVHSCWLRFSPELAPCCAPFFELRPSLPLSSLQESPELCTTSDEFLPCRVFSRGC